MAAVRTAVLDPIGFVYEDFNGMTHDAFTAGEQLKGTKDTTIVFPDTWPNIVDWVNGGVEGKVDDILRWYGSDGKMRTFDRPVLDRGLVREFLRLNYQVQVQAGESKTDAVMIAHMQLTVAKAGLIHPDFKTEEHNVLHNDCVWYYLSDITDDIKIDDEVKAAFTAEVRNLAKQQAESIIDLIAYTAYVFRVRGHHYRDKYNEVYDKLAERCERKKGYYGIEWSKIVRNSLHAIYPDTLDFVWNCAVNGKACSGTMQIRWNCPSAGTASIFSTYALCADLFSTSEAVPAHFEASWKELSKARDYLKDAKNRWVGSVNAIYYNAAGYAFDDSLLGALAAAGRVLVKNIDEKAHILKSGSLERIAKGFVISGHYGGRMLEAGLEAKIAGGMALKNTVPVTAAELGVASGRVVKKGVNTLMIEEDKSGGAGGGAGGSGPDGKRGSGPGGGGGGGTGTAVVGETKARDESKPAAAKKAPANTATGETKGADSRRNSGAEGEELFNALEDRSAKIFKKRVEAGEYIAKLKPDLIDEKDPAVEALVKAYDSEMSDAKLYDEVKKVVRIRKSDNRIMQAAVKFVRKQIAGTVPGLSILSAMNQDVMTMSKGAHRFHTTMFDIATSE